MLAGIYKAKSIIATHSRRRQDGRSGGRRDYSGGERCSDVCRALDFEEGARDGLAEITGRYVVFKMEEKIYADVGSAQVRGGRKRRRLGE